MYATYFLEDAFFIYINVTDIFFVWNFIIFFVDNSILNYSKSISQNYFKNQ